jgi:hypothetical protein
MHAARSFRWQKSGVQLPNATTLTLKDGSGSPPQARWKEIDDAQ